MDNAEFARLREPIALVVDDKPLVLMDHVYMIAEEGYAIVEATTALQAYEFLEQHSSLQLLFTDVETPARSTGSNLRGRSPPGGRTLPS